LQACITKCAFMFKTHLLLLKAYVPPPSSLHIIHDLPTFIHTHTHTHTHYTAPFPSRTMVDKRGLLTEETGGGGGYSSIPSSASAPLPPSLSHTHTHSHPTTTPKGGCRDPLFLAGFLLNVGVIVWLAADYGASALRERPDADDPSGMLCIYVCMCMCVR
jgi:hypothetical protein